MSDRRTAFDAITKDKPTLAGFLRSLPCIEAPWDAAFQKRYYHVPVEIKYMEV